MGSRRVPEEWLGAERQRDQGVGLPKVGPQPIAKLTIAGHNDLYDHPDFAQAAREALMRVEGASREALGR